MGNMCMGAKPAAGIVNIEKQKNRSHEVS